MVQKQGSYERGPYAKGRQRRVEILRATLRAFSELGYRGASMRAIATQVGVSPTLLQHYFEDREHLLAEVITAWDAENDARSEGEEPLTRWLMNIRNNPQIPGLIRLYTAFAVEATDPGHPARTFFENRYQHLTASIVNDLDERRDHGELSGDMDTERLTRILIAACEGLQLRWLHHPNFDVFEDFQYLLTGLGIVVPIATNTDMVAAVTA